MDGIPVNIHDYETYCNYIALRNHFYGVNYDYFKYNGKTNVSLDSYKKRKDKIWFSRLSIKYRSDHAFSFFLSQFAYTDKKTIYEMGNAESQDVYNQWQTNTGSLWKQWEYFCWELCVTKHSDYCTMKYNELNPFLLDCVNRKYNIELCAIFFHLSDIFQSYYKSLSDNIVLKPLIQKCKKYYPFLTIDENEYAKLLIPVWENIKKV